MAPITAKEYTDALLNKEKADKIIHEYNRQQIKEFQTRLQKNPIFTDSELVYASRNICSCGHGLAYPNGCGPMHYWSCSAVLKGIQDDSLEHLGPYPFMTYSILSEDQPSALGVTTRGKVIVSKVDCTEETYQENKHG